MEKTSFLEDAYQAGFEDEMQKMAADPEYKSPGYLKGIGGAMKAYYTDKPLSNIGKGFVGTAKGMGSGLLVGGAAGAAGGGLAALAKRMRGVKGGGKALALAGAGIGAYLGATGGGIIGGEKTYRKTMAAKGIRRSPGHGYFTGAHQFTPKATSKYFKKKAA